MRKYITVPFEEYSRMKNHNQSGSTSKLTKDIDAIAAAAATTAVVDESEVEVGLTGAQASSHPIPPAPSSTVEPSATDSGIVGADDEPHPPQVAEGAIRSSQQMQQQQMQQQQSRRNQMQSTTNGSPPPQLDRSGTGLVVEQHQQSRSRRQWKRPTAGTENADVGEVYHGGDIADDGADDEVQTYVKESLDPGSRAAESGGSIWASEDPTLPPVSSKGERDHRRVRRCW